MRTHIRLRNRQAGKLPAEFHGQDVRYSEDLVATFLRQYTRSGDRVLDPFAGYGTTLLVAEAMDRVAYGIEFDGARARYIRSRLRNPELLIHGDSRELLRYDLPMFDFSMTSPPYMNREDPEDPFANYTVHGGGYAAYLRDISAIYGQLVRLMKPGAHVVLEVANLKSAAGVTMLAWDVAQALAPVLRFEGEVAVGWEGAEYYGYNHSYCLVFSRPAE